MELSPDPEEGLTTCVFQEHCVVVTRKDESEEMKKKNKKKHKNQRIKAKTIKSTFKEENKS